MKKINLESKTFIISGCCGYLGQKIVDEYLKQGSNIIAIDNNEDKISDQIEEYKSMNFYGCRGDITDRSTLDIIFENAVDKYGKIDGAINLAYPRNDNYRKDFLDVSFADFSENTALHLGGYFVFMQKCVQYSIEKNQRFSLINFSSIYGNIAPKFEIYKNTDMTMPVEYAAVKSGLQHLTKYITKYTFGTKFRANCISPGGIYNEQNENFLDAYNSNCRSKGMLDIEDIIGTTLFLSSDLSNYICGQNIIVDDGFSV